MEKKIKHGAIIARFQVPTLHDGHIHLIESALKKCDKLIILLGEPSIPNNRNPLSFEIRKQMILEKYPNVLIFSILDHHEDLIWSESVDNILTKFEDVTLFGSRDSFFSFYKGRFSYEEIDELKGISGTDIRNKIMDLSDTSKNNEDFRRGIIYAFNLLGNHYDI